MKKLLILLVFASCSKSVGMSAEAQNADRLRKYYESLAAQVLHDRDYVAYSSLIDSVKKYDSIYFALTGKGGNPVYEDFNGNPQ